MTDDPTDGLTIEQLTKALRRVDPEVYLVPPRILRRLIRARLSGAALGLKVPHRKSLTIGRESVLEVVERQELGLPPDADLPETLILLEAPDPHQLAGTPARETLRVYWRLHFHARVHASLEAKLAEGPLSPLDIRECIGQMGEVEFDEVRNVLRREHLLLSQDEDVGPFVEFVAVYFELRFFDAVLLVEYFPALVDHERIDAILARVVDAEAILERTRPLHGLEPVERPSGESIADGVFGPSAPVDGTAFSPRRSPATYQWLMKRADRASSVGNLVRSVILRTQASRFAAPSKAGQALSAGRDDLARLARRLQKVLKFDDDERRTWETVLPALMERSARGFWTSEARLLYDLQKVCLDHERDVYRVDLVSWLVSFGKRPINRHLPNQREVQSCKHLRHAGHWLIRTRIAEEARSHLSRLIHHAIERAEGRLRDRFRPLIDRALERSELRPGNIPEAVAREKLVEEMLDKVVQRGFLTIGDLRDALSRNQLKLPDLTVREFLQGDRLLRADKRLAISLEGVYRRGEIYLRMLQKLSSTVFGTPLGRLLTLFVILPFGGAFVVLEGLQHLVEPVAHFLAAPHVHVPGTVSDSILSLATFGLSRTPAWQHAMEAIRHELRGEHLHLVSRARIVVFGVFLSALIHVPRFRLAMRRVLRLLAQALYAVFIEAPRWLVTRPFVRSLLRSRLFVLFQNWILLPLILTAIACLMVKRSHHDWETAMIAGALTFVIASLLINSRRGRDLEELLVDRVVRTWHRVRVDLLPGLYRVVMEFFEKVLEGIDRLLYSVDEWLRFRSGERGATLLVKGLLGVVWSWVTYVVRFCVNLLLEPQINPIKHFPVVTVAHKVMLPFMLALPPLLIAPPLSMAPVTANGFAFTLQLLLPGVFGFLVWELKENWRLYEANRPRTLRPVVIGQHGETMVRLLRPGFHSGTLPKHFDRLRRSARRGHRTGQTGPEYRQREVLHHVEESVRHFVEREFLALIRRNPLLLDLGLELARVELATNRVRLQLVASHARDEPWCIAFEERSGGLVAVASDSGWLRTASTEQRRRLATALAGLYKLAGVELLREPIEARGPHSTMPEDDVDRGIPAGNLQNQQQRALYDLWSDLPVRSATDPTGFVVLSWEDRLRCVRFGNLEIRWRDWVNVWTPSPTEPSSRSEAMLDAPRWPWSRSEVI